MSGNSDHCSKHFKVFKTDNPSVYCAASIVIDTVPSFELTTATTPNKARLAAHDNDAFEIVLPVRGLSSFAIGTGRVERALRRAFEPAAEGSATSSHARNDDSSLPTNPLPCTGCHGPVGI